MVAAGDRDIVFYGKHTFGEFLASEERVRTSVLADPLARLVSGGILSKQRNPADRRREFYSLTGAGLALVPVLVELANWGARYDPRSPRTRCGPARPKPTGQDCTS